MNKLVFIGLFFVNSVLFAQDTTGLKVAKLSFNLGLLYNDSNNVKRWVAKDISYGHSNGWIQSRQDMINDMFNGKLQYKKVEVSDEEFAIHKEAVVVTSKTKVEGVLNKTTNFSLNLMVMQVWKRVNKQWMLIARQSVKID